MTDFYDELETRDPELRERALLAALPAQVAHARERCPAYAELLREVDPAAVTSREVLAALPLTRKSALLEAQRAQPPFGGFVATPMAGLARVFASPGPIYEPEGRGPDPWRLARALHAAGVRRGDLVHNSFSYHMTPAGSMLESAAHALGCAVFPAGVGQTEQQVEAIAHLRPRAYTGTPSFLAILLDKASELGRDVSSLACGLVSGEAFPPSLRERVAARGVDAVQCYATADLGLVAYETAAREGLVLDEGVLLEIVRPGTGDPVPPGEVGEVVVTTLASDYPLIRFATGDLSAVMAGSSPCGRTNVRIRGWMGRADQTTKVRGLFVHPSQVAEVVRRHPEIARARLVVASADDQDVATLRCETADGRPELLARVAESVRDLCKVRAEVEAVAPGVLPNDGKVIEDARRYD
ncbi:MAG: AMP-binding protein [Ectothiorhodospiraceae bacterium]|nr:AMP-binding protein [Chromatiales bacterium]MCP5154711.1 AMP-binding protein [Ectothiorhodospiraceae bacterium]